MSNEREISRRGVLGSAAGAVTFLAGCTSSNSETEPSNTTENRTGTQSNETVVEETVPEETEADEAYNDWELDGLAERIEQDLEMEGYDKPESLSMTRTGSFRETDLVDVRLDLDSVLHLAEVRDGSNVERNQDAYLIAGTNNLDQLYQDTETRLGQVIGQVNSNVVDFLDEKEMPEDKESLEVSIDVHGARGSNLRIQGREFQKGEEHYEAVAESLNQLEDSWNETGPENMPDHTGYHPMRYEDLMYLGEGEEVTVSDGSEEYTLEVVGTDGYKANLRVNGEEQNVRIFEDFEANGEEVRLGDVDPMYMEDGVELEFESSNPEYFGSS